MSIYKLRFKSMTTYRVVFFDKFEFDLAVKTHSRIGAGIHLYLAREKSLMSV